MAQGDTMPPPKAAVKTTAANGAASGPAAGGAIPAKGPVNPRKMMGVQAGFSMLDWGLLNSKARNLSGRGRDGLRSIKMSEVRQHKTEHDCWTVYKGKVYNIGPFIHYHPGGVKTILCGAGKDCTALFEKYHSWVNADSLLSNLLLGYLEEGEDDCNQAAEAATKEEEEEGEGAEVEAEAKADVEAEAKADVEVRDKGPRKTGKGEAYGVAEEGKEGGGEGVRQW